MAPLFNKISYRINVTKLSKLLRGFLTKINKKAYSTTNSKELVYDIGLKHLC
jgi:hypothetical protein